MTLATDIAMRSKVGAQDRREDRARTVVNGGAAASAAGKG